MQFPPFGYLDIFDFGCFVFVQTGSDKNRDCNLVEKIENEDRNYCCRDQAIEYVCWRELKSGNDVNVLKTS